MAEREAAWWLVGYCAGKALDWVLARLGSRLKGLIASLCCSAALKGPHTASMSGQGMWPLRPFATLTWRPRHQTARPIGVQLLPNGLHIHPCTRLGRPVLGNSSQALHCQLATNTCRRRQAQCRLLRCAAATGAPPHQLGQSAACSIPHPPEAWCSRTTQITGTAFSRATLTASCTWGRQPAAPLTHSGDVGRQKSFCMSATGR